MTVTPMTPILLTNCGMVKKPEKWSQEEAKSIRLEGIYETIKQIIVYKQEWKEERQGRNGKKKQCMKEKN